MSYTESWSGKINRKLLKKLHIIDVAAGREKADLVLKNATYVNVFSGELDTGDIAVAEGLIVGLGSYEGEVEYDMTGKIVCPGFVDGHSHSERPLLSGEPTDCKTMQGVATENLGLDGMSPPLCDLSPYSGEVRARTGCAVAGRGHPQDDFAIRPARSGWRTRASPCPDLTRISWPSTSGPCWTPTAATIPASIPPGCPMFWRTGRLSSETAS